MRFTAYLHNTPPGADPDGGSSDLYVCERCGSEVREADVDGEETDESGELVCVTCGEEARGRRAEQAEHDLAKAEADQQTNERTSMQTERQSNVVAVDWLTQAELEQAARDVRAEAEARARAWEQARVEVSRQRGRMEWAVSSERADARQVIAIARDLLEALERLEKVEREGRV